MSTFLTYAEVCATARFSIATFHRRLRSGQGPRVTEQGKLRFVRSDDLAEWLEALPAR